MFKIEYRQLFILLTLFAAFFYVASDAAAQTELTPKRGVYLNGSFSAGFETINNTNGNVMFNLPLASLPAGRGGMSYGISLSYNSKLFDVQDNEFFEPPPGYENTIVKRTKASETGGWRYGIGYQLEQKKRPVVPEFHANTQDICYSASNPNYKYFDMYKFVLTMPDGSQKEFTPDLSLNGGGNVATSGLNDYHAVDLNGKYRNFRNIIALGSWYGCEIDYYQHTGAMRFYTTDGSFLRLEVAHDNDTDWRNNAWTLTAPDGTRITQSAPLSGEDYGRQRIYDRNDNYVEIKRGNVTSTGEVIEVTDQLDRKLTVSKNPQTLEDVVSFKGVNNAAVSYTVKWKNIYVRRQYWMSEDQITVPHPGIASGAFKVIDEIILPPALGGQSYKFQYNGNATANSGSPSEGFGEVSQVELPTGAKYQYQYKLNGTPLQIPLWKEVFLNPVTTKKMLYQEQFDGQTNGKEENWTYAIDEAESTVTAPDGGITKTYYGNVFEPGGGVVSRTILPNGTIQHKEYLQSGTSILPQWNGTIPEYECLTVPDAAGNPALTAIKKYEYDLNGNVIRTKEYDWVPYSSLYNSYGFFSVPAGAVLKRTSENAYYNPTPAFNPSVHQTHVNAYQSGTAPRILNAVKAAEITGGNGTPASRSELYYDDPNNKGNLTETRTWDSTKQATLQAADGNGYRLTSGNYVATSATYNSSGNLLTTTDAKGVQTTLTYGAVTGPNGAVYDLYPTQTVAAANYAAVKRTSTAQYDFYTGLPTSATDADNNLTSATDYDALGRPLKVKTAVGTPLEIWTQTEYDDVNRRTIVRSDVAIKGDGKRIGVQHFDQLGRVRLSRTIENAATENPYNEADGIKVQTRYSIGNPHSYQVVSNPYRAATAAGAMNEPSMGWTRSKSINTGKHAETETFSGAGLPAPWSNNTSSTGKVQTDLDADRTLITDQVGKQRLSKSNALGQLTDVWEITAAEAGQTEAISFGNPVLSLHGLKTSYGYDTLSNLTTVLQGSQTRTFAYSSLSRLKSATNPELGTTPTNGTINYQYDDNGNLTGKIDPRGVTTTYGYDALNRVIARSYSAPLNLPNYEASLPVTYIYDNLTHAKGKLTKVITGNITTPFAVTDYQQFDQVGRVTQSQQTIEGVTYGTSPQIYKYNLSGALLEQTYPSGRVVKNVLDNDGDLALVQSKRNGNYGYWNYAKSFTYTAAGAVSSMQLGNGRWESTVFNSRLQPTQIALGSVQNGTDKLKLNFAYHTTTNNAANADNNGNVLSQTITVPTETRGSTTYAGFTATQNYTYDSLNRLKSAEETIPGQTGWKQTFKYDRYGNRNFDYGANPSNPDTTTPNAQSTVPKVVNPEVLTTNNRFKQDQDNDSIPDYLYDAAGNTTRDANNKKFTYDGENHQTKVETVSSSDTVTGTLGTYFYDGDGKRVKKVSASETTIFIYDAGGKLVAEYANQIATTTAQVSYLTSDHLGSPRINTDQNGIVTSRHDYQPFGEEIYSISGNTARTGYSADDVRKQFTSYERDNEIDLDFAQARYFDSGSGRFTSPDPIAGKRSDPQSLNKYVYVRNNPLIYIDPTGETLVINGDNANELVSELEMSTGYKLNRCTEVNKKTGCNQVGQILIAGSNKGAKNVSKNLASLLKQVVGDLQDINGKSVTVTLNTTKNDSKNFIDRFSTRTVDVGDLQSIRQQGLGNFVAGQLGHILAEYGQAAIYKSFDPNYQDTDEDGNPKTHKNGNEVESLIMSELDNDTYSPRRGGNLPEDSSTGINSVYIYDGEKNKVGYIFTYEKDMSRKIIRNVTKEILVNIQPKNPKNTQVPK